MKHMTDRRTFVKDSLTFSAAALFGGSRASRLFGMAGAETKIDLAVVKGSDYFVNTIKSVELLGGMSRFVSRGAKVGLLINAPTWWKLPGSHAGSALTLAVVKMCLDAGAGEVRYLLDPASDFWKRTPLAAQHAGVISAIKACSGNYVEVEVKDGVALKKAGVIRDLFDCDVFINIPVAKHHAGTNFSGCLKNWMGALQGKTCRFFHSGSGKSDYEDVDFLSQCIADVNTLRRPRLCIADATLVLGSNGPAGPGDLRRFEKVVAGTDPVAIDTYCVGLHGRRPEEIVMLKKAADHGLGRASLAGLAVKEVAI